MNLTAQYSTAHHSTNRVSDSLPKAITEANFPLPNCLTSSPLSGTSPTGPYVYQALRIHSPPRHGPSALPSRSPLPTYSACHSLSSTLSRSLRSALGIPNPLSRRCHFPPRDSRVPAHHGVVIHTVRRVRDTLDCRLQDTVRGGDTSPTTPLTSNHMYCPSNNNNHPGTHAHSYCIDPTCTDIDPAQINAYARPLTYPLTRYPSLL